MLVSMKKITLFLVIAAFFAVFQASATPAQAFYPQDIVVNGGFEANPVTGWNQYHSVLGNFNLGLPVSGLIGTAGTTWHNGTRGARLGDPVYTEYIIQQVTIPDSSTSATLSLWYALTSDEFIAGHDALVYFARNVMDYSEQYCLTSLDPVVVGAGGDWTQVSCDMTAAKGKTVDIVIGVTNDFINTVTVAKIDDVSLTLEFPDGTAPTTSLAASPLNPDGANGYYLTTPAVSLTASDDIGGSGIATIFYAWDGGSEAIYTTPLSVADGIHTLAYRSVDGSGNSETTKTAVFSVDSGKPTSTATLSAAAGGANGWYLSAPAVTLAASDTGSGSVAIRFRWDSGAEATYTSAFTAPEGTHTLSFWATDAAGNVEDAKTLTLKVDLTKPTAMVSAIKAPDGSNGWYQSFPTITLAATDTGSGVSSLRYRWDTGANSPYTVPVIAPEGIHTLFYSSVDQAGNASDEQSIIVKVDSANPVVSLNELKYTQSKTTTTATISGKAVDSGSGVVSLTVDGKAVTLTANGEFSFTADIKAGVTPMNVVATDAAGRSATVVANTVKPQVLGAAAKAPVLKRVRAQAKIASVSQQPVRKYTLTGENFTRSTKVKVGKLTIKAKMLVGKQKIKGVVYKNSTTLVISLPLNLLRTGKYNVTVINPDGLRGTLKNGMTITRR